MKTRTLLLLAIGCGLAILVAGMFVLLRLDHQTTTPLLEVGQSGQAGDAVVKVDSFAEQGSNLVVTVTVSGVADPAGVRGFALVAPNRQLAPSTTAAGACGAFTVAAQQCTLTFATASLEGSSRQLLFERATDKLRWRLIP